LHILPLVLDIAELFGNIVPDRKALLSSFIEPPKCTRKSRSDEGLTIEMSLNVFQKRRLLHVAGGITMS
jgi:hypothetical protein